MCQPLSLRIGLSQEDALLHMSADMLFVLLNYMITDVASNIFYLVFNGKMLSFKQ